MSIASLEQALSEGSRILVDSSTLLAHFDGSELITPLAEHVIETLVASGRNPAIVSMITVMEVLVRPLRFGADSAYLHVLDFLQRFPNLRTVAADIFVAQQAAGLRSNQNFSAPDALIIATGLVHQVGHLVTNDRRWQTKLEPIEQRISVCYLGDHLPV